MYYKYLFLKLLPLTYCLLSFFIGFGVFCATLITFKVVCFMQHFTHLLSSNDLDILLVALQALASLVKINLAKLHLSGKLPGSAVLNLHFLALSQGWGSKEGVGLFSCVV